ncbi:MAG: hypothetical protein AVDCRST_MAG91-830, partial [uncultured Sphingomonadaceae bacterium]
ARRYASRSSGVASKPLRIESEITSSPSRRRTPRTPADVRDWNSRTSVAEKRTARPSRVARRTSSSSVS